MAQHVQACRRRHRGRLRARILRVDQADGWLQPAAGDAGLGVHRQIIEDGDAGGFAACAGRGGNGDERFQRAGNGPAFADGRVDVFQQIGGIATVQVGGLGGVHRGAAADGDEGVEIAGLRDGDGFQERFVGGLDAHAIEDRETNLVVFERLQGGGHGRQASQKGIGEDQHVLLAQVRQLRAHFARDSKTKSDGGGRHLECVFCFHEAPSLNPDNEADKSVTDGYSKIKQDVILRQAYGHRKTETDAGSKAAS